MMANKESWPLVDDYIKFAESLSNRTRQLKNVQGVEKLERKIKSELKFLISLRARLGLVSGSHLKSTNLSHFASLVHALERLPGVVRVLQPFQMPFRPDSLVVDIVAGSGHLWVKVVARKAQALHLVWAGQGQFGERDLIAQAEEYLECAKRHPYEFQTPQVVFVFYNQVTQSMSDALEKLGVSVLGERVPVSSDVQEKLSSLVSSDEDSWSISSHDDDEVAQLKDRVSTARPSPSSEQTFSGGNAVRSTLLEENASLDVQEYDAALEEITHSLNSHVDIPDTPLSPSLGPPTIPYIESVACPEVMDSSIREFRSRPSSGHGKHAGDCCSFLDSCGDFPETHTGISVNSGDNPSLSCLGQVSADLFLHLVASPPVFETMLKSPASVLSTLHYSPPIVPRVNLDITSLIALVSSVTNGHCHMIFRDKVLSQQAREEQEAPILPLLTEFLKGKELFVCETALSSFKSILDILGGQREKERAEEFLATVHRVQDQPSERSMSLPCQGRVKNRSKVIFGTGDTLQAVTVTSNMGFVRAAKSQGITFAVFLHQARALTEEKEKFAIPLESKSGI